MNSLIRYNLNLAILDSILLSRIIRLSIIYKRDGFIGNATTVSCNNQFLTIAIVKNSQLSVDRIGYNPFNSHYTEVASLIQCRGDNVRMIIRDNNIVITCEHSYDRTTIVIMNKVRDDYWIGSLISDREKNFTSTDMYIFKIDYDVDNCQCSDIINVIKIDNDYIVTDGQYWYLRDMLDANHYNQYVTDNMKRCYESVLKMHQ